MEGKMDHHLLQLANTSTTPNKPMVVLGSIELSRIGKNWREADLDTLYDPPVTAARMNQAGLHLHWSDPDHRRRLRIKDQQRRWLSVFSLWIYPKTPIKNHKSANVKTSPASTSTDCIMIASNKCSFQPTAPAQTRLDHPIDWRGPEKFRSSFAWWLEAWVRVAMLQQEQTWNRSEYSQSGKLACFFLMYLYDSMILLYVPVTYVIQETSKSHHLWLAVGAQQQSLTLWKESSIRDKVKSIHGLNSLCSGMVILFSIRMQFSSRCSPSDPSVNGGTDMTHQTTPSRRCLSDVADNAHQRRIRCEDRKILKLIKHTSDSAWVELRETSGDSVKIHKFR